MPLTFLHYGFLKFLTILAGIFEFYFGWFFCCNEKGESCWECKNDTLIFSVLLAFASLWLNTFCWFYFKLLINCDCSPGMNTNNFLVNIWLKLDSRNCQSGLWGIFQETDFWGGGWWEGEAFSPGERHGIWILLIICFCKTHWRNENCLMLALILSNFYVYFCFLIANYFYCLVLRMWRLEFLLYVFVKFGAKILWIVK